MDENSSHDHPRIYAITVNGRLDESWESWFDGMTVIHFFPESTENDCLTILGGCVADQAALRGLLMKVWDLNLELVSVVSYWAGEGADAQPEYGTIPEIRDWLKRSVIPPRFFWRRECNKI